jgi:hypothetical protein
VTLRAAAGEAAATLAAVVAAFAAIRLVGERFGTGPEPAIVAAVLALTLARRALARSLGEGILVAAMLAGIGLVALAVGRLLLVAPPLGAVVFTAGMALALYLHGGTPRVRRIGRLIALPLVAILIVPRAAPTPPGAAFASILLTLLAGPVAYGCVAVMGAIHGSRSRETARDTGDGERAERTGSLRPPVHTRLALQAVVGLGSAFAVGFVLVPDHWTWVVVTAFIVGSGARGRGDAAYKALLRLGGAVLGTLAAVALGAALAPTGLAEAVTIFALLFVGLWLRTATYAAWAACVTVILGVLAGPEQGSTAGLLVGRLAAIVAGGACAVAAAWFVFPIRTHAVIRRRLNETLVAFDDIVANAQVADEEAASYHARFARRLAELRDVAGPVRLHRLLLARNDANHAAAWIAATTALAPHAARRDAFAQPSRRGAVRRAVGITRRAIGSHGAADAPSDAPTIAAALDRLHATLAPAEA